MKKEVEALIAQRLTHKMIVLYPRTVNIWRFTKIRKKTKVPFDLDMTRAFHEGGMKRKKPSDDPEEKEVTGGHALHPDTYM